MVLYYKSQPKLYFWRVYFVLYTKCIISVGDHIREFRIQYDGDDNYLRNVEVIGLYTIVGFVKGGSPMYRHMDSGGHNNYIYRDPNGDKPGEDKYGSIWKGVVMIIFLFYSLASKYYYITSPYDS